MGYEEDPCKWVFLPELVEIYKTSPKSKLCAKVNGMPWIKYINILEKLSELDQEIKKNGPPPAPGTLETVMCCWLKEVCPNKYCEKFIRAIHEFACAIGDKVGEVKGSEDGAKPEGPCPEGPCDEPKAAPSISKEQTSGASCDCLDR